MTHRSIFALAQPAEGPSRAGLVELQAQVRHALHIVACLEHVLDIVQREMGGKRIQGRPPSLLHDDQHYASCAQQSSVASLHAGIGRAEEFLLGDHSDRLVEIRSFHALVRSTAQRLSGIDLQSTRLEHQSTGQLGFGDGLQPINAFDWQRFSSVRSHAR